jgi:hypothetical protein
VVPSQVRRSVCEREFFQSARVEVNGLPISPPSMAPRFQPVCALCEGRMPKHTRTEAVCVHFHWPKAGERKPPDNSLRIRELVDAKQAKMFDTN